EVALLEGVDAAADTLVLGDDVTEPAQQDLVQSRRLDLVDRQVERTAAGELGEAAFELGTPPRVAGVLEAAARSRVEHDDRKLRRQRDIAVLLGAAVEQDRAAAAPEQRGGGVQQAD